MQLGQVETNTIEHNVGQHSTYQWHSDRFGDICGKIDKNFDGFKQRQNKGGDHRLIN